MLADTWSRWWSATLDGQPVPVLVVDHALRGVVVGTGRHEVVFRFSYPVFWAGLAISALAAIAAGVVLWRARPGTA